jgi:N-acetylneuraminate lyase
MKPRHPLHGLIAATHTPFHADGSLALGAVEKQAAHLLAQRVSAVFIGGTTGESSSLTTEERLALAQRWMEVTHGTPLPVVVHVGANCLADARALAAQAEKLGAVAISALAPSYFKPRDVDALIACCAEVAGAAPATPFYYYDIPSMTGLTLSPAAFLEQAPARIPTLVGLKFTNPNLMAYLQCLQSGDWDIPWGVDEWLLGATATGALGAVGSTYNFAAPIYHDLLEAFHCGDLAHAQVAQNRSAQVITVLNRYGFMGAAKATMGMLGVPVGPARLPNQSLTAGQLSELRGDLEKLGFFEWVGRRG